MSETACTQISSARVTINHVAQKAPITQEQIYFQCGSPEAAMDEIISKEDPDHIALGEPHAKTDDGKKKSALRIYAEQLLPLFIKNGRGHLVIENLLSDDACDAIVESYLRSGKGLDTVEQVCFYPQNGTALPGLKQLLQKVRELRQSGTMFRIYGGGPRHNDKEKDYAYAPLLALNHNDIKVSLTRRISQRTVEKVKKLRSQGAAKVDSYNGSAHNDVINTTKVKEYSFGRCFSNKKGYKYIEVDILSPEFMQDKGGFQDFDYPVYATWLKSAVPQTGATLIKRGHSSYTILLPEGILKP